MPRFHRAGWPALVALGALVGCADNALVLKGQVQSLQQQQLAVSRQNEEMQHRTAGLDRDNQELNAMLAQSKQRTQVLEDQLTALREQLGTVNTQLTQTRQEKQSTETKVQALTASLQRRGGVTITPNNSLLQTMPVVSTPGVSVRRDGDVIRVELPGGRLFDSASARLKPGAAQVITSVGLDLLRLYPDQIIGVEGHTDSDQVLGGQYRNNHELSVARAVVVQDVLVNQARFTPTQLFVVGHGPNHPVVSNGTADGKERNRRVELVIYPEKVGR
jgi:flagellar motor protein MotB